MMKNVLVTAIGTITSTNIVRELKKTGDFFLFGADINNAEEIVTSLDVGRYFRFPLIDRENYLSYVLDFCKENSIEYYFASLDIEVDIISAHREEFESIGTKLCVPDYEFVKTCHYKDVFTDWINSNFPEIAIKSYKDFGAVKEDDYPIFTKPIEGVAGKDCFKIGSPAELHAFIHPEDVGVKCLLQEFVRGENITVDCIRNRKTEQKAYIQRKEILRNANGCGTAVEIIDDPELSGICDAIAEKLDLNGVCNMEFFRTDSGYKMIEINPRFSAGAIYTSMAGNNIFLNAVRIADGEMCEFGEIDVGSRYAERYEAYRM
ncbi:MAG: ATP-grasp domain-containing protein [Butyrivibrio sp.]|nr:ATP-grasp domain-containing protein [Butyrivibrio sp.]